MNYLISPEINPHLNHYPTPSSPAPISSKLKYSSKFLPKLSKLLFQKDIITMSI